MSQPSLLDLPTRFDSGVDLQCADHVRLGKQLNRVLSILSDGQWYSVPGLKAAILQRFGIADPEPSLSAQIRNAKKPKHGSHAIERKREGNAYFFRLGSHD